MTRRKKLKVYRALHDGVWLGGCSVIVAENKEQAVDMLNEALEAEGLSKARSGDVVEIDLYTPSVHILFDGDY